MLTGEVARPACVRKESMTLSDVTPDVRELTLTGLGPEGLEAKLTLADDKVAIEAAEEAPLPQWLRGELAFEGLDMVYVDPAKKREGEEEKEEGGDEEDRMKPGFRVTRVIEIKHEETGESFPRTGALILDGAHVDLAQAEAFAATFARLAGREKPEEAKAEADEAPAAEAEAPVAAEVAPTTAEEPAFAAPSEDESGEPEEKAFV